MSGMLDVKGDYNAVVTIYSILKESFVCTENSGVGEVRGEVRLDISRLMRLSKPLMLVTSNADSAAEHHSTMYLVPC